MASAREEHAGQRRRPHDRRTPLPAQRRHQEAAVGQRALGLREAVAQRDDDRVGADRGARAGRSAAGVVVQESDDDDQDGRSREREWPKPEPRTLLGRRPNRANDVVHQAAQMSRKRGRIILVGVVGLDLQRDDFYEKELSFQVSCSYGPGRYDPVHEEQGVDYPRGFVRWTEARNFEAVLALMAGGQLDPAPLITHRFDIGEAQRAYDVVS